MTSTKRLPTTGDYGCGAETAIGVFFCWPSTPIHVATGEMCESSRIGHRSYEERNRSETGALH